MAKVSINISIDDNISIDEQLKKEAQMLFADLGMDLTTAVTIYLRQAVREQRIPFEITRSAPSYAAMADEEMESDPNEYECYDSFDDDETEVF